ncbi:uncharacterized protein C8R40DRAFT_1057573, partial [Lentinula edodes]|uniref:uncharacterized protein n=1 Tax=Lentinula edodes TaxID=5353 RepID=UPI001E8CEFF9
MLIARVRHSKCFVRVQVGSSNGNGHCKLVSNVIAFENPIPKIYDVLPPPRDEIDEVLAVMFSGSCKPTDDDYKRSLLFVRRNVVANALQFLILNSSEYEDVTFSEENLATYSELNPIVSVEYFKKGSNRNAAGVSIHDDLEDDGLDDNGDCLFTVHGIVGEDINHKTAAQLRALAIKHLDEEGKFMRTTHAAQPESIWNNPHLYPKMF